LVLTAAIKPASPSSSREHRAPPPPLPLTPPR
jgi:hypothetical protein